MVFQCLNNTVKNKSRFIVSFIISFDISHCLNICFFCNDSIEIMDFFENGVFCVFFSMSITNNDDYNFFFIKTNNYNHRVLRCRNTQNALIPSFLSIIAMNLNEFVFACIRPCYFCNFSSAMMTLQIYSYKKANSIEQIIQFFQSRAWSCIWLAIMKTLLVLFSVLGIAFAVCYS